MAFPPRVIGDRIRTLREQLGFTPEQLARPCGLTRQDYLRIESGDVNDVAGDHILIISRILKVDFRYFISNALDEIESETSQIFRALGTPTHDDLVSIRRLMQFCGSERDLEEILGIPQTTVHTAYELSGLVRRHKDQGKEAAKRERSRLALGDRPIENIFNLLRAQGVRLNRTALEDSNVSGVTICHPHAGVCVLVNYVDDMFRQFFSAAHEYGHVLFDRPRIDSEGCIVTRSRTTNDWIEVRANAFAAELMLPMSVIERLTSPRSERDTIEVIQRIARQYYVNIETVAIRMKEVGKLNESQFQQIKQDKTHAIPRGDKNDPDLPASLSHAQRERLTTLIKSGISTRFLELLRRAFSEQLISFGRFAEMLDMTVDEAVDLVRVIGVAL